MLSEDPSTPSSPVAVLESAEGLELFSNIRAAVDRMGDEDPPSVPASAAIRQRSAACDTKPKSARPPQRPRTGRAKHAPSGAIGAFEARGDPALEAVLAGNLGDEATIRVLKAKVRVMQEELDMSTQELSARSETINKLQQRFQDLRLLASNMIRRLKVVTTENKRSDKVSNATQAQLDKYQRMASSCVVAPSTDCCCQAKSTI